ncbi:MAG TPA: protein kinase [Dehalococcoidia bacterium]|nr:protein kinase [Dehalococcoidia bacterium]
MKCPYCDRENREGRKFCSKCGKQLQIVCPSCQTINEPGEDYCGECGQLLTKLTTTPTIKESTPATTEPTSFINDRYRVIRKLGEGGKKKAYLVHDTRLDRDVAFALIKTENLTEDARKRIVREAQAMGKLGDHPNIMSIFEMDEINGQPYIVMPNMSGGDVEGLIEKAQDHKLPLDQVINIAKCVCKGLEFAHSKGVIHRDIKPGNIWLAEDGTAKIGDFGLAMMTDVSRLTQEGLMVGTYSYMSPEQAVPGEVTYKADLYSLGAMLYEMVTGRPPFVGDDMYAIIGGHLNTQPILPSWHRADLPPAFQSLIMLLLEKDPQKRPNSASDVLQAIESIDKGDIKESVVDQQVPTENPIYRRIFVGRENELKQLQNSFVGAMSGQGALIMVVGEPGIGKTSVCEQLATFVTLRGGMTLWGHCYEEGSLSLPYLAFVEAMRSYVLDRDPENLKKEMGSGVSDVARIVSEIREKLHVKPRESQNPEEDRYRLMQAVTSFLTNAAVVKPMLVILEDLHDADKGTLEMLSYVSRNLARARVLIIGTYRDVEVDRNHPLSAALAELRRVSSFGRVLLRGLNVEEVRRMLISITHEDIPIGLAEAIHRQTEGNPLFVQEVVRYLTEEKLLESPNGKFKTSEITKLEMNIPEGLRDVIGKRLTNLSEECNKILSIAAVIGREFRLDVLEKVAGITEDEVYKALEEAKGAAIVEERSAVGAAITYRFAHPFFRQTLYEEIIAPRRIRLHQHVAQTLEIVYAKRLTEHAVELAEHFSYSPDLSDLGKAVQYGEMAAQRAMDVYDYGEAVRLLEQALKVQEVLNPDDTIKRCDLLQVLGETLSLAGEPTRAYEIILPEAFSLAVEGDDRKRAAHTCKLAIDALSLHQAGVSLATDVAAEWAERADKYADPDTVTRASADLCLGLVKYVTEQQREGARFLTQALNLARQLDDPQLFWEISQNYLWHARAPQHTEDQLKLAEEIVVKPRTGVKTTTVGMTLLFAGNIILESGQREKSEEIFSETCEIAERTGQTNIKLLSMWVNLYYVFLDGRLDELVGLIQDTQHYANDMGRPEIAAFFAGNILALRSRLYLSHTDDELQTAIELVSDHPQEILPLAYLGRNDEVNDILEHQVIERPGFGSTEDEIPAWKDISCIEAAVLVKNHRAAELLLKRISNTAVVGTMKNATCTARHMGDAARLLGKPDEANEYYQIALDTAHKLRFRPEIAFTRFHIAELLLENYPDSKKEAIDHLNFAINEFRVLHMQPSLEKALRHKDILKA